MMYGYNWGYGPEYTVFHVFDWIFWIVVVILIFRALRWSRWHRGDFWGHDRSMDVLKERYAKGEISKEEFEAKKKDLMG